jgi:hypothetical protein
MVRSKRKEVDINSYPTKSLEHYKIGELQFIAKTALLSVDCAMFKARWDLQENTINKENIINLIKSCKQFTDLVLHKQKATNE